MAYLLAGPFVAIVGIVAVFFVLRRKSVEKRSMYSARREQIEHKVRAARQRTLAPHGHAPRPAEAPAAEAPSPFAQTQVQPMVTYETPAYQAPPAAPPPPMAPQQAPEPPPWEQPSIPAPAPAAAPSSFDYPVAQPEPFTPAPVEPFRPAPEPSPMPAPSEPSWTPAPRPAEPLPPAQTMAPAASATTAASATSAGGWSVVSTSKESTIAAEPEPKKKRKGKDQDGTATGAWQLASGEAPNIDGAELELTGSSATIRAAAQYAVLVVGLVMVLIGVLVMLANSHVT